MLSFVAGVLVGAIAMVGLLRWVLSPPPSKPKGPKALPKVRNRPLGEAD